MVGCTGSFFEGVRVVLAGFSEKTMMSMFTQHQSRVWVWRGDVSIRQMCFEFSWRIGVLCQRVSVVFCLHWQCLLPHINMETCIEPFRFWRSMIGNGNVKKNLYLTRRFRRTGTHTVYSVDLKYLICVMFINSLAILYPGGRNTFNHSQIFVLENCWCECIHTVIEHL